MIQRRQLPPRLIDSPCIKVRPDNARAGWALGQDASPRVDDSAVAVGFSPAGMCTRLSRGDEEREVLDRSCTSEGIPVCFPGFLGESRRQEEGEGVLLLIQFPEKLWKPEVIADCESEIPPGGFQRRGFRPGLYMLGFFIGSIPSDFRVEEVNFVVAGREFTFGREDESRVCRPPLLGGFFGRRCFERMGSADDPNPILDGPLGESFDDESPGRSLGRVEPLLAIFGHQGKILGKSDEVDPAVERLEKQVMGLLQVQAQIVSRVHLNGGRA